MNSFFSSYTVFLSTRLKLKDHALAFNGGTDGRYPWNTNVGSGRGVLASASRGLVVLSIALVSSILLAPPSQAEYLNHVYFEANGGDATSPETVQLTLTAGYSDAHEYSKQKQFLAAGTLGNGFLGYYGCTTTWLGNDVASNKTYLLTAAHCVEPDPQPEPKISQGSISTCFTDWQGNKTVLSGTFHLPPERMNNSCGGGACCDIAILELDGQINIQDSEGRPVAAPLLYDGNKEKGFENTFLGYGLRGVGNQDSIGLPRTGRSAATNVIDTFIESDKGVRTDFDAPGTDNARVAESTLAPGDSGSAWWQKHLGKWAIIATTNGGSTRAYGAISTGARVSQYIDWIKTKYPGVQLWSENVLIGDINLDGVVDGDLSGDDDYSAFIKNWQSVNGPSDGIIADLNEDHIVNMADFKILSDAVFENSGVRIDSDALPKKAKASSSATSTKPGDQETESPVEGGK